jgi:ribonuclease P protein subunit RPR2
MVKAGKSTKSAKGTGVSQKHLHSRISYLYQAANYLSTLESNAEKGSLNRAAFGKAVSRRSSHSKEHLKADSRFGVCGTSTGADESKTQTPDYPLKSLRKSENNLGSWTQTHHLLASMRSISQKTQIRLSTSIKRSVCRRCNGLLSLNSTAEIENLSRAGRKSCADVLVVTCCQCAFVRRYPVGMGEEHIQQAKKEEKLDHRDMLSDGAGNSKHVVET